MHLENNRRNCKYSSFYPSTAWKCAQQATIQAYVRVVEIVDVKVGASWKERERLIVHRKHSKRQAFFLAMCKLRSVHHHDLPCVAGYF